VPLELTDGGGAPKKFGVYKIDWISGVQRLPAAFFLGPASGFARSNGGSQASRGGGGVDYSQYQKVGENNKFNNGKTGPRAGTLPTYLPGFYCVCDFQV
jgi:hypothetical protein